MRKVNFNSKAISTIIADLPTNEAWWVGTNSEKYIVPVEDVFELLEAQCEMIAPCVCDFEHAVAEVARIAKVDPDEVHSDNTYNSCDNLSNSLAYHSAEGDDGYYIAFAIHRGGDIRCNYTDFVIFKFDSFEACWEAVNEAGDNRSTSLEVDGKTYIIAPETVGEHYEVWCTDDSFQTEIYPDDITDEAMAKAIREVRA